MRSSKAVDDNTMPASNFTLWRELQFFEIFRIEKICWLFPVSLKQDQIPLGPRSNCKVQSWRNSRAPRRVHRDNYSADVPRIIRMILLLRFSCGLATALQKAAESASMSLHVSTSETGSNDTVHRGGVWLRIAIGGGGRSVRGNITLWRFFPARTSSTSFHVTSCINIWNGIKWHGA